MLKRSVAPCQATPELIKLAEEVGRSREPGFIASRGQVIAVLLSPDIYNALLERLEDLEDSLDLLKARVESEGTVPWEAVKAALEARAGLQD